MQYLWQFFLLLGLMFIQGIFFPLKTKKGKNIFLFLVFAELSFIAGFRAWNIGNDTINYIYTFILSINFPELIKSHMEKGYLLYNQSIAFFTHSPQVFLLISAIIIIGSVCFFIRKYSSGILLSILLFVILYFGDTMNIMRQYLALSVVLLALPFVIKRQFLPFCLCCVIASSFHISALLAISLYFLYCIPFKIQYLLGVIFITILTLLFLTPIIEQIIALTGRYNDYQGTILLGEDTKIASIVKTLIQGAITCFCIFSYKYCKNSSIRTILPISFLLWCSVAAVCIQFISIRGTVLERLVIYFSIFNLLSIPLFVGTYSKPFRILIGSGLIFCFVLYACVIFIYRPDWNHILPFSFCF